MRKVKDSSRVLDPSNLRMELLLAEMGKDVGRADLEETSAV